MRKLHTVLLAITAISSLILISLVVFAPDHTGELRTDLAVGDYYIVRASIPTTSVEDTSYTIVDVNDEGLYVVEIKTDQWQETTTMSKGEYLGTIYLDDKSHYSRSDVRAILEMTGFYDILDIE